MRGHIALALVMASSVACGRSPTAPSLGNHSLIVNGLPRTYSLHVPASFQPHTGSLVIALHGAGGSGTQFEQQTGLTALADLRGFAIAYPDGLYNPALRASDWQTFGNDFTDDISFLHALIASMSVETQSDAHRVYIAGFSDGGRLAHRAGAELSDQIAAIGDVGGSLFQGDGSSVSPARGPVSILILHGDGDAYCGKAGDASQDQTFNYWLSHDACAVPDTATPLCDASGSPTDVIEKSATECRGGVELRFYKFAGGGHAWYPGVLNVPGQLPYNASLNATTGTTINDILWTFFAAHAKQ